MVAGLQDLRGQADRDDEGMILIVPLAVGAVAISLAAILLTIRDPHAGIALRPVLALIELISYFVRPVSHSIRLAGAMMAGHAVAKVFAGFTAALGMAFFIPILAVTALYALELLVAVIQAYVFTILTCVYLKDALHPHH